MFKVRVTNGIWCQVKEMPYHKDWVRNQEEAESMAEAQMNKSWKVIKG